VLLFALAGCDQLFELDLVDPTRDAAVVTTDVAVDASDGCIRDMFTGSAIDQMWNDFSEHTQLQVTQSDRLIIDLTSAPSLAANAEAGVRSFWRYDFRGGAVSIEVPIVVSSTTYMVQNYLEVRLDFYNRYTIEAASGIVAFVTRVNGTRSPIERTYSAIPHRFWRIANPPGTTKITFSTGDGEEWTVQREVDMTVPVDDVIIGLIAGSFSGGDPTPGRAEYDNLVLCATRR
jgi:hypothetical protein